MGKTIVIAAANSLPADTARADAVCTGARDELVLSGQIALLTRGGTLLLLDGDYYIDSFPFEDNTAVYFGYNDGNARAVKVMGDTENKGYNTRCGAVIHVTEKALRSLPDGAEGRVFVGTKQRPEAEGVYYTYTYVNNLSIENLLVLLWDASRPVIGIDLFYFGSGYLKLTGVFTESYFDDRYLHKKPLAPAKGCIGIRSTHGANDGMASIGFDTVYAGGVYTGFRIMGMDHLIMSGCGTCRCCIGYEFAHSCKTLTMINCCDEGNTHLPRFYGMGQLTCLDFNIERFNENYIPDDLWTDGEPGAAEQYPGMWHGSIGYTLEGEAYGLHTFWKKGHGSGMKTVNLYHDGLKRPEYPEFLEEYFDRAKNIKYIWNGEYWVDPMGNRCE